MRRFIQADIVLYLFLMLLGIGGFFIAVVWPQTEGFYAFIILAALGGVGVTSYIFYAKRFKKHLSCPMGSDCDAVVTSKYSKFFGIPLEYLGFLYYVALITSYSALLVLPEFRENWFASAVLILTSGALFFSVYLVFVQAFLLRQWCIWCLLSAMLSTTIFVVSLTSLPFAVVFLKEITGLLVLFQSLGFVIGIGAVTISFFLFFRYLRNDLDIDDAEADTLLSFSNLGWFGLGITLIATYTIYVADPAAFVSSSILLIQLVALSVVFISGAIFNLLFAPVISMLPFYQKRIEENKASFLDSLRKATLITAGISLTSWYFAFAVHYMFRYSFVFFLLIYAVVLLLAVSISLLINWRIK